jgi:hypothetical protein
MGAMPVWGTVTLLVLAAWLLGGVALAFAIGRAIRLADARSPRPRRRRAEHGGRAGRRRGGVGLDQRRPEPTDRRR